MTAGLTGDALHGAWWQLWTCHLVHWNARHLLWNAIAAAPPLVAIAKTQRIGRSSLVAMFRICVTLFLCAPLLSIGILVSRVGGEYRGASGLVVALWVLAGAAALRSGERVIGIALLLVITAKIAFESIHGMPDLPGFTTLPLVHYLAFGCALIASACDHWKGARSCFSACSQSRSSSPAHAPQLPRVSSINRSPQSSGAWWVSRSAERGIAM